MSDRPTTPRARARERTTREIVEAGRRQLAEVGPAALSLRAVAREIGVVSSAVYRYVANRDALLTLLLVAAYDDLGAAAERAEAAARDDGLDPAARFGTAARALRSWASEHPHDWALLYGSPVPGYAAPPETVGPATRVVAVWTRAALAADPRPAGVAAAPPDVTERMRAFVAEQGGEVDEEVLPVLAAAMVEAWTSLVGTVSFELFGHYENVVTDRDAWFDRTAAEAWRRLTGRP